jgi:ubiquitin C-terminal hydrolase
MAFGGDEQQDSVEYINFLIDGLHEDTNMRTDKPYFEAPNSDGKDTLELGLETWSNQIQRDWSFIYFMFYGQWQSTLQCLSCKKQSSKFDVSNTIALSMPEPSKLFLNIVVHRLPSNIKQIISPVSSPQES